MLYACFYPDRRKVFLGENISWTLGFGTALVVACIFFLL
jgi:hypothetical protein